MKKANNYNLVIVDPTNGQAEIQQRVSFSFLGIKERENLEQWLLKTPEILGELLLPITTEFSEFDQSKKRLDILALDENKKLVVIELKRDASGSLADLQAIRYAAFCSTMKFEKLVSLFAEYARIGEDDAKLRIRNFVHDDGFDKLDDKPRIMLVAGSFDDQHLTSAILWLSKFGVDITCVELTPYRLPGTKRLAIVPKVIIPLPQAKEYLIQVKEKELAEGELSNSERMWYQRNQQILSHFRTILPDRTPLSTPVRNVMKVLTGSTGVHFEWWQQAKGEKLLIVGLHFETSSKKLNQRWCEYFRKQRSKLERAVGEKLVFDPDWRGEWASVNICKPFPEWSDKVARWAAEKMAAFITATQPMIDSFQK